MDWHCTSLKNALVWGPDSRGLAGLCGRFLFLRIKKHIHSRKERKYSLRIMINQEGKLWFN